MQTLRRGTVQHAVVGDDSSLWLRMKLKEDCETSEDLLSNTECSRPEARLTVYMRLRFERHDGKCQI